MTTWHKNGQRGKHLGEEGRRADVWFPKCFYSEGRRSATTVMLGQRHLSSTKLLKLKNPRLNVCSHMHWLTNSWWENPLKWSGMRQPASVFNSAIHRCSQTALSCYLWIIFLYQSCCDACYCKENGAGAIQTNSSTQFIQPHTSTSIKSESQHCALPRLDTISFKTLDIGQRKWGAWSRPGSSERQWLCWVNAITWGSLSRGKRHRVIALS